jgi:hypothetical protein
MLVSVSSLSVCEHDRRICSLTEVEKKRKEKKRKEKKRKEKKSKTLA